ncbi:MAG: ATP-binding cassette domain-containing protein [Anaerolineae bacterium]
MTILSAVCWAAKFLGQLLPPRATALGEEVLSLEQLETHSLTAPVSLKVRAGEIVGLAGQLGSGAAKLLQAVAGLEPLLGGDMKLRRQPYAVRSIRSAIQQGVAYCSDDRQRDGIFPARPVVENLSAPSLKRITHFSWLSRRRERQLARAIAQTFAINPERLGFLASTFSGGNQQKLAVGKWLGIKPHVLLLEEPTRGVDVGARAEIYAHLRALAERGLAIVFASSDLPEVLGLADTVVSFYRGKVVRVAPAAALDQEQLLRDVTHEDSAAPDSPTREGRHG